MTHAEEVECIAKAKAGCERSQEALLRKHAGIIGIHARFYAGRSGSLTYDDLEQEGKLGLLVAVQKFDPSRGWRFATLLGWWVRQAMQRATEQKGWIIRVPNYATTRNEPIPVLSLDYVQTTLEGEEQRLAEMVPAEDDVEAETLEPMGMAGLQEAVDSLPGPYRLLVTMRFNLDGLGERKQRDVAEAMGVTKQRVSTMEHAALNMLREYIGLPKQGRVPRQGQGDLEL